MPTKTLTQKKVKRIGYGDGKSLNNLDLKVGELIAFDCEDEHPQPFVITRAGKNGLVKLAQHPGSNPEAKDNELYLIHSEGSNREYWKLHTDGISLGLYSPHLRNGVWTPHLFPDRIKLYVLDSAYVGAKEIIQAFRNEVHGLTNFSHYIPLFLEKGLDKLRDEGLREGGKR